jgi:hypothetical protein
MGKTNLAEPRDIGELLAGILEQDDGSVEPEPPPWNRPTSCTTFRRALMVPFGCSSSAVITRKANVAPLSIPSKRACVVTPAPLGTLADRDAVWQINANIPPVI